MKKKRVIILVILLPAALVLFVMGIIELLQPKFVVERPTSNETSTRPPPATSTLAPTAQFPSAAQAESSNTPILGTGATPITLTETRTASLTATPSVTFTNTPIPHTPTASQTPCVNCTPTPSYLSTLVSVMRDVAGDWYGIASMRVDKGYRHNGLIKFTFYEGCTSGVVCGEYHDESTCSGFLTFHKMSGITYIFASHPTGEAEKCGPGGLFYLKQKAGGNLSLTIYITDLDGRKIVRSATLMRR
jgi:hypothetical protein